jgi:hypothetical protein
MLKRLVDKKEIEWFDKTANRLFREEVSESLYFHLKEFDKCPLFFDNLYDR